MVRLLAVPMLMASLLLPAGALAQEAGTYRGGGQGWSVLSGRTVGAGRLALHGQAGFPGISLGLLGGLSNRFDVGGRVTFNYALEGRTDRGGFDNELKLQVPLRLGLMDTGRFNLGLHFEPGPLFWFHRFHTDYGLALPLGLVAGFPVGSAMMVSASLEVPFYVLFDIGVYTPLLFGGGLEYFIDRSLAVTLNLRMGPTFRSVGGGSPFTLNMLAGVAYRF